MIEKGISKSWKITVHTIFKNIYEKLNKNFTDINIYVITLFLKNASKQ